MTAVTLTLAIGFFTSTWLFVQKRETAQIASQQRDDILILSDDSRLEACIKEADALSPPHPEKVAEMEAWLAGTANDLSVRLPRHRAKLKQLEMEGVRTLPENNFQKEDPLETVPGLSRPPRVVFEDPEIQFQYDRLSHLVYGLEIFVHPDPYIGTIANVKKRLAFAKVVFQQSIQAYVEEWDAAISSISNENENPFYNGLELSPQIGLVPVGQDNDSGFWEFGHLYTGDPPVRDATGNLVINDDTGIVLVLVPGGCFWMGATSDSMPDYPSARNWDRFARWDESPVHEVCLDPFFISKYEMTQAQWLRATGKNPSKGAPGVVFGDKRHTLLHSLENVNWWVAAKTVFLLGLDLPTEAQWEYAARAGTETPRWFGRARGDMQYHGNVCDQYARQNGKPHSWIVEDWNDGYADTAPVGSYRPNPFGLHDVFGNVGEWCRDRYGDYRLPVRPKDGLRQEDHAKERIMRGGDFTWHSNAFRVSRRVFLEPVHLERIGIRPILEIKPDPAPSPEKTLQAKAMN